MNVIAIDGPTSSGKSSVAKIVADKLNIMYVTSGMFYRTITHLVVEKDESKIDDFTFISAVLDENELQYKNGRMFINNEDLTSVVTNEYYTSFLPTISAKEEVRNYVNKKIRELAKTYSIVIDGRDIGTVVFPDALVKIYLDADVEVRAKRRYEEVKNKGYDYEGVLERLKIRDEIDSTREVAPLKVADDARVIDSTNMSIEEIVDEIVKIYNEVVR